MFSGVCEKTKSLFPTGIYNQSKLLFFSGLFFFLMSSSKVFLGKECRGGKATGDGRQKRRPSGLVSLKEGADKCPYTWHF